MKNKTIIAFFMIALSFALYSCRPGSSAFPTATIEFEPSAQKYDSSTPATQLPIGKTIVVNKVEDNGLGTSSPGNPGGRGW